MFPLLISSCYNFENFNLEIIARVEHVEQANQMLRQKVEDLEVTLPSRFQERTQLSSTNLFCPTRTTAIGVGFFFSSATKVITALHILDEHYPDVASMPSMLVNGVIHRRLQSGALVEEEVHFQVLRTHKCFDLAVLELHRASADAFLEIPSLNYNFEKTRMAITTFSNFLHEQAPNEVPRSFCVLSADFVKASPHHIVYTSNLFSGDSGGAILMSHDGVVRALHQETVNQADDQIRRDSLNDDTVVNSINSLISGLSQGFIGLRLDAPDVQQFILS